MSKFAKCNPTIIWALINESFKSGTSTALSNRFHMFGLQPKSPDVTTSQFLKSIQDEIDYLTNANFHFDEELKLRALKNGFPHYQELITMWEFQNPDINYLALSKKITEHEEHHGEQLERAGYVPSLSEIRKNGTYAVKSQSSSSKADSTAMVIKFMKKQFGKKYEPKQQQRDDSKPKPSREFIAAMKKKGKDIRKCTPCPRCNKYHLEKCTEPYRGPRSGQQKRRQEDDDDDSSRKREAKNGGSAFNINEEDLAKYVSKIKSRPKDGQLCHNQLGGPHCTTDCPDLMKDDLLTQGKVSVLYSMAAAVIADHQKHKSGNKSSNKRQKK